MTVERPEYRYIVSFHNETDPYQLLYRYNKSNSRCTEGHTPEDSFLVNEKSLQNGLLMFLRIRFGSCR